MGTALRDSVFQTLCLEGRRPEMWFGVTLVLLLPILLIGISLNDLGLVNELVGSIFGALISTIFPGPLLPLTYKQFGRKFCHPAEGKGLAGGLLTWGFLILFSESTLSCLQKAGVHL